METTQSYEAGERTQTLVEIACADRREKLERLLGMQDAMERIVARLPDSFRFFVRASDEWIQLSSLSREQVKEVLSLLHGGRWTKQISHGDPSRIDYEAEIDGIQVKMYCAEAPESCRIEVEEVEIPAHKETRRKLVCA